MRQQALQTRQRTHSEHCHANAPLDTPRPQRPSEAPAGRHAQIGDNADGAPLARVRHARKKRTKKRGQNNAADPPAARHRRDVPQRVAKRRQRLSNLTQPPSPRRHPLTQPPPDLQFARAMLCQHRPAEEGGLLPKRAAMQARKACNRGAPEEGVGGGECSRSEAERGARTYADSDDPGGQR